MDDDEREAYTPRQSSGAQLAPIRAQLARDLAAELLKYAGQTHLDRDACISRSFADQLSSRLKIALGLHGELLWCASEFESWATADPGNATRDPVVHRWERAERGAKGLLERNEDTGAVITRRSSLPPPPVDASPDTPPNWSISVHPPIARIDPPELRATVDFSRFDGFAALATEAAARFDKLGTQHGAHRARQARRLAESFASWGRSPPADEDVSAHRTLLLELMHAVGL